MRVLLRFGSLFVAGLVLAWLPGVASAADGGLPCADCTNPFATLSADVAAYTPPVYIPSFTAKVRLAEKFAVTNPASATNILDALSHEVGAAAGKHDLTLQQAVVLLADMGRVFQFLHPPPPPPPPGPPTLFSEGCFTNPFFPSTSSVQFGLRDVLDVQPLVYRIDVKVAGQDFFSTPLLPNEGGALNSSDGVVTVPNQLLSFPLPVTFVVQAGFPKSQSFEGAFADLYTANTVLTKPPCLFNGGFSIVLVVV